MKKRFLIAGASVVAGAAVAAKLLSRPHDVSWSSHARELHHAEDSYFIVVNGVRIHYQESGPEDGPAIILIHGFCSSNQVWSDVFLPLAAAGYRVIAPDLIGFGFSEKPGNAEYTIEMQSRMIIGLMDQLRIDRATLIGSSYGGSVAVVCALDYPERVGKLGLVSAVINNDAKKQMLLRLAISPVMGDLVAPFLLDSRALMRWRLSKIYAPQNTHLMTEERIASRHSPLRTSSTHRAVVRTLRHWDASRITNEAQQISSPTLLIWGEHDADAPLSHGEYLHSSIPGSRLFVFRHCGHLPQEEYPLEFVEIVTNFLESDAKLASAGRYGSNDVLELDSMAG